MKKAFLLFALLLGAVSLYAQEGGETDVVDEYTGKLAKNTLFVEGDINGIVYSLNYDRIIIAKPKLKIAFTGGLGLSESAFADSSDIDPVVNISVSTLLGKSDHKLEFGVGVLTAIGDHFTPESHGYYTEDSTYISKYTPARENTSLHLTARIGYRYQRETGGLFFRVGFMPSYALYTLAEDIKPRWGATIGVGYTFKNKTQKKEQ